jgi:hypothetical protein
MRRHVHSRSHAAESFVSFIPSFDGTPSVRSHRSLVSWPSPPCRESVAGKAVPAMQAVVSVNQQVRRAQSLAVSRYHQVPLVVSQHRRLRPSPLRRPRPLSVCPSNTGDKLRRARPSRAAHDAGRRGTRRAPCYAPHGPPFVCFIPSFGGMANSFCRPCLRSAILAIDRASDPVVGATASSAQPQGRAYSSRRRRECAAQQGMRASAGNQHVRPARQESGGDNIPWSSNRPCPGSGLCQVRRTPGISCEAVPASILAGAGMRRHVRPCSGAAESFVSFIPLFDGRATRLLSLFR